MKEHYVEHGEDPFLEREKMASSGGFFETWYDFKRKQWFILELSEDEKKKEEKTEKRKWGLDIYRPTVSYISPITGKEITDRGERRAEMKQHGYREADPSEFNTGYKNSKFADKHGLGRSSAKTIM